MVDATAMMGVLGWGGGDGDVPWRCSANDLCDREYDFDDDDDDD